MIKKFCSNCDQETWHNQSGKKDGPDRCTFCGYPVKTNVDGKRAYQTDLMKRQIARRALGLK